VLANCYNQTTSAVMFDDECEDEYGWRGILANFSQAPKYLATGW
jgi:hypothetical protein